MSSNNEIIGSVTAYHGQEHSYLRGFEVRIVAVLHNGAMPGDDDGEIPGYQRLECDADIARFGGVTANDRIEVAPWIATEGRFSWATSDARATDLAAFEHLRSNHG